MQEMKTQRERMFDAIVQLMPEASLSALSDLEEVVAEFGTAGDDGTVSDGDTVKMRWIAKHAATLRSALADAQSRLPGS